MAGFSNAVFLQFVAVFQIMEAFHHSLQDPAASGGPISVPLAGNHADAKARVAEIVESLDLHPIDLGAIDQARWIEGMAILLIHNNFTPLPAFNFHLREVQ